MRSNNCDNKGLLKLQACLMFLSLMVSVIFISPPSHARPPLTLGELPSKPPKPLSEPRICKRKHNDKPRGFNDPHFPVMVKYEPVLIDLPETYTLPESFVVICGKLDLRSLTSAVLLDLTIAEFEVLLKFLSATEIRIKWVDKNGDAGTGKDKKRRASKKKNWDQSNAAAALALDLALEGQTNLLATMLSIAPESILPIFKSNAVALISSETVANTIKLLMLKLDDSNSDEISQATANLVQIFLKYWAGRNVQHLTFHLNDLIEKTRQNINALSELRTERRIGVLLGSLLAGSLMHANEIKEKELKRLVVINSISNLVWAATSFLAAIPVAGTVIGGLSGGISVGVVAWAVVHNLRGIRHDYVPNIKEIEGRMEMRSLGTAQNQDNQNKLNVLMTLSWMRAAIHVNGLSD